MRQKMKIRFTTNTPKSEVLLAEDDIESQNDFKRVMRLANGAYCKYFRVNPKCPFHLSINGVTLDDYTTAKLFLAAEGDNPMSSTDIIERVLANHS